MLSGISSIVQHFTLKRHIKRSQAGAWNLAVRVPRRDMQAKSLELLQDQVRGSGPIDSHLAHLVGRHEMPVPAD